LSVLTSFNARVWADVEIETDKGNFRGIILPRSEQADDLHVVVKLQTGYNIGLAVDGIKAVKEIGYKEAKYKIPEQEFPFDPKKPNVTLLGTGGTIASRLDYRTGAVIPAFTPGELYGAVPELADICNMKTVKLFGVFSENMGPEQYITLAEAIGREISNGADGIVIGHGTDTMHHTAACLSFMVQDSARGFATLLRPALVRRRAQPHPRRTHRGLRRHRRGHDRHVRPDFGPLRATAPRHPLPQDALLVPLHLPHRRRHPTRHRQPRQLHVPVEGLPPTRQVPPGEG